MLDTQRIRCSSALEKLCPRTTDPSFFSRSSNAMLKVLWEHGMLYFTSKILCWLTKWLILPGREVQGGKFPQGRWHILEWVWERKREHSRPRKQPAQKNKAGKGISCGDKKSLVLNMIRGKKIVERCLGCVYSKARCCSQRASEEFALNKQNKREDCFPVSELVKTLHFQLFSKQTCGSRVLLWGV